MSIHPFLEKQGIERVLPYTKLQDRMTARARKYLFKYYGIDNPEVEIPAIPIIVGSDGPSDIVEITIHNGEEKSRRIVHSKENEYQVLNQQEKYLNRIRNELKDRGLGRQFSEIREKWSLQIENQSSLFNLLSSEGDIYLPYIIRNEDLVQDISKLCREVNLRKDVLEEFGMVAAYLCFGELMQLEGYMFISTTRTALFKVLTPQGYRLFLELKPNSDTYSWNDVYSVTRSVQKEKGFIQGDGSIGLLASFVDNLQASVGQFHVLSVPKRAWSKKYREVRHFLDGEFGSNIPPRDESLGPKTIFIIEQTAMALSKGRSKNSELAREIADDVSTDFADQHSGRDIEYSESAVWKVWERYPDIIEQEKLKIKCP